MTLDILPTVIVLCNATAGFLLVSGYIAIRRQRREAHKKFMIAALICSALFLIAYLIHHYRVGSVPYPYHDWTRTLYYIILAPHVVCAALIVPFIVVAVVHAVRGRFERHRRIVRWLWPVWMFVSASGVVIYFMLYRL